MADSTITFANLRDNEPKNSKDYLLYDALHSLSRKIDVLSQNIQRTEQNVNYLISRR